MSDTVKLIIEIPKITYEDLKAGKIYSSLCEAPQGLIEGIQNGTPLDDVKTEIEEYKHGNGNMFACGLTKAIEILDNAGKGE